MGPIDRFTRDEVSAWVWWPAALLLIVGVVLTVPGEQRAVDRREREAIAVAPSAVAGVLEPILLDAGPDGVIEGAVADRLRLAAVERILTTGWVEAVRVWGADGQLRWSSDPGDPVGSAEAFNDEELARALSSPGGVHAVRNERDVRGAQAPETLARYVATTAGGAPAVVELSARVEAIVGDVRSDWIRARIVLGIAALLVLGLAIAATREPVARIGAGVPFYPTSLPPGMELVEADRDEERGRLLGQVRELTEALRASEDARRGLEEELRRANAQLATLRAVPGPRRAPSVPTTGSAPARSVAQEDVVVIPEADTIDERPAAEGDDVLERLVEPVSTSRAPVEDPSVLRARLAHTAAAKKPWYRAERRRREGDG